MKRTTTGTLFCSTLKRRCFNKPLFIVENKDREGRCDVVWSVVRVEDPNELDVWCPVSESVGPQRSKKEDVQTGVKRALNYSRLLLLKREPDDLELLVSLWSCWCHRGAPRAALLWLHGGIHANLKRRGEVIYTFDVRGCQRHGSGSEGGAEVKLRYLTSAMTASNI